MSIFIAGLDLGQTTDPSALVIVEATGTRRTIVGRDRSTGLPCDQPVEVMPLTQLDVRHVERFPLNTKYVAIENLMRHRMARVPMPRYLVLDKTGVGMGVYEMFTAMSPIGITFTSGGQITCDAEHSYHVPKRDLIGCAQVLLQNRVMRIAKDVHYADLLISELLNFRMKISTAGHDTYEAWRQGDHDDLVNALAMACWIAQTIISTTALAIMQTAGYADDMPRISPY